MKTLNITLTTLLLTLITGFFGTQVVQAQETAPLPPAEDIPEELTPEQLEELRRQFDEAMTQQEPLIDPVTGEEIVPIELTEQDFAAPTDTQLAPPQPITVYAKVIEILEEQEAQIYGTRQLYQKLKVQVYKSPAEEYVNQEIEVESGNVPNVQSPQYKVGDKVLIAAVPNAGPTGETLFYVADYVRTDQLLYLFILFAVVVIAVTKFRGIASILGMGASFVIIFTLILPGIIAGYDPTLVAIGGSAIIIPITFYLSHGINRKTTLAIISTIFALLITGGVSKLFIELAHLTGFASEEALFLQIAQQGTLNVKGLIMAGIIIGTLGILDDATVSQTSITMELKKANPDLKGWELFNRAMNVGRDHIASTVNTLILVYTGASLPLLLLFINTPQNLGLIDVLNFEVMAEEIIRMLGGSIGLVLAVPIAAFITMKFGVKSKPKVVQEKLDL